MGEAQKPSLHVDTDWKRQAQEEKRRLAEEEQKRRQQAAPAAAAAVPPLGDAAVAEQAGGAARENRELPPASFTLLVQSLLTQVLYHLGDLAARGSQPVVNLDMARHHIDTLGILEEKTRGNLTAEEKSMLDRALYEARMRFVSVASEVASYP